MYYETLGTERRIIYVRSSLVMLEEPENREFEGEKNDVELKNDEQNACDASFVHAD